MNWSMAEQGVGIVCACIVLLRCLLFSCSRGRAVSESEESIRTFGMSTLNSRVSRNTDLPNTDRESTVSFPLSEDMQMIKDVQRPASAALIGVAVPLPKSESNTNPPFCAVCSASQADVDHCSNPRFSDSSGDAPLAPHLAAFK